MDRYHIYEEIGKGKFSQVYKGREKKKIQYVAIKRVDKAMMNHVVNEVQIMHRLKHPHLIRFYDWYETKNNLWLILEYCTGGDLQSLLQQDGHIPEASVRIFALDILAGLKHLHSLGLLHCDLQPKNILIDEYGILKICDFKLTRRIPKSPLGNQPMSSRGCPLYMAPELFSNEGAHSYSSDFWALGCIMFELRMNGTPFSCKWHRDQQTTPEDQVSGFYQEEVDGTPQDILENIRKFQLSTIVDMIIARSNRSDKIKRQQRSKSPSKGQYNPNSGAREEFVPTISPELMDLLCWILDRIPSYRCTWDQLTTHPFWEWKSTAPPSGPESLHPQPAFESMLKQFDDMIISNEDSTIEINEPSPKPNTNLHNSQFDPTTPYSEKRMNQRNTDTDDMSTTSGVEYNMRRTGSSHSHGSNRQKQNLVDINLPDESESIIGEELQLSPISLSLILHPSDTQVKPIINNRYIEPIEKYSYTKSSSLPFTPIPIDGLENYSQTKLESYLGTVYKFLQSLIATTSNRNISTSLMTEKINLLSYLCTIASNSEVANIALSKPYLPILLMCIKTSIPSVTRHNPQRQSHIPLNSSRSLAAALLALYIRYANYIEPPTSSTEEHIIPVLCLILKDSSLMKSDPVLRHKCIAALGELIFYISAQDDSSNTQWMLSNDIVLVFGRSLSDDTDEIMRHYAAKTIENVLIQGVDSIRSLFGTIDIASRLLDLAQNSRNSTIQAVCGMALFHLFNMILRLSDTPQFLASQIDSGRFIVRIMEKTVLTGFLDCLRDGRPKLQQAYLNILIIIFGAGNGIYSIISSTQKSIIDDSLRSIRYYFLQISNQLFLILCRLIDQGSAIAIKGKSLLVIELICRYQPILISNLNDHRLHQILNKILDSSNDHHHHHPTATTTTTTPTGSAMTPKRDNPMELYVIQCGQSFIILLQYLLSHSIYEIIQELKTITHITTPRGLKFLTKNKTTNDLPPPPPSEDTIIGSSPNKNHNIVTPVKTIPKSPSSMKKSKSTPLLATKTIPTLTQTNLPSITGEYQMNNSITILRGCISLISHPSLQKHVINSRYLYSISTALQLISDILADRTQYQIIESEEEKEFLIASEQSILLALESVSQVDFLDSSLDERVLKAVLIYLIPSAVSYCRICDGDARVIIMFALRKLIPYLASRYYQTRDLRVVFVDKVLLQLPIEQLLHDQSPVPQYMIRLLSEICSVSDDCCQDLTRCFLEKQSHNQENLVEPLFQLLEIHNSEKHASTETPSNKTFHDHQSDPQVIILLRQLLSSMSSELYALLMKQGVCLILSRSILSSIRSLNCEHLLVSLELLQTLFTTSRNEMQRIQNDQHPLITTSAILTSLETNFQSIILPLLGVLHWNPSDPSQERAFMNVDPSMIFLLHDCTLKSLLLLIDLIPDVVVESLLQDKLSTSRISRIFLNEQWDFRLLSKLLNILLKLMKIPSTRRKELKIIILSPEIRSILGRYQSMKSESTNPSSLEEETRYPSEAVNSVKRLSEQLLNL